MSLEHSFFRQHGLTVAFAALLATACGGTFSGTGTPGSGGTGASAGAGGSPTGAGGGPVCNAACPLVACDGPSTILPGECCPTCEPSGGAGGVSSGGAGGVSSGGAAGGGSCVVACDDIGCAPGWISVYQPGACCPSCVPSDGGSGGVGGCGDVACPAVACGNGYALHWSPDSCCPTCVPNDSCTQGQQSYEQLREKLISQPGAVACKVSNDCALLSGNAYCGDECSAIPVNAAAAQSLDSQLSAYAAKNCSTCTPEYPPCAAPLPPTCVDGQCAIGMFLPD